MDILISNVGFSLARRVKLAYRNAEGLLPLPVRPLLLLRKDVNYFCCVNGTGMQNNRAYIVRAIVLIIGAMRRVIDFSFGIQSVTFTHFVTFCAEASRPFLVPCSTL